MDCSAYFKSVIDQDACAVVICNLQHEVVYMNPAAIERYEEYGGAGLMGKSLLNCHNPKSCEMIEKTVAWFKESTRNNRIYTAHSHKENKDIYMVALRNEAGQLIGYYEKHEYRNAETAKQYDFNGSAC